jgi:class 3 adenylate cyclase
MRLPFARAFPDPELEKRYIRTSLLDSHLLPVSSLILTLSWLIALLFKFITRTTEHTSLHFEHANKLTALAPVLASLSCLVVSSVPGLKTRYLVKVYPALLVVMGAGHGLAECLINSLRGRPVAPFWVMTASMLPVLLQARAVQALVYFHMVHGVMAAVLLFGVGSVDEFARSQRHLFLPRIWQLYANAVLSGLLAMTASTVMCDQMDRMHRKLFMERWLAVRGVAELEGARERGKALCRNLLPEIYADKVFAPGGEEVTFAEVSDLVGVLAVRFAPPRLALQAGPAPIDELQETKVVVKKLDTMLMRLCGGAVEKVSVHDGVYVAASNIAITPSGPLSHLDPGQRFLQLLMLSVASVTAVAPTAHAGLHIGRCASGVLGSGRLAFDIFGESVNTALALCESSTEPGMIRCSSAARAMIPRQSAKWGNDTVPVAVPGLAAPLMAFQLIGLYQKRLPDRDAPALPHSVPAETIPLYSPIPGLEPKDGRTSSLATIISSTGSDTSPATTLPPSSLPLFEASYPGKQAFTGELMREELLSPPSPPPPPSAPAKPRYTTAAGSQYLLAEERATTSAWGLSFKDPALERAFHESMAETAFTSRFGPMGLLLMFSVFFKEVTLPDGILPVSVVLPVVSMALFGAHHVLSLRRKLSVRAADWMLAAAEAVGGISTIVSLMAPWRSPWAEIRFVNLTSFMVLMSGSLSHPLFSIMMICSQVLALMAYFSTHKAPQYFLLINRPTFPIIIIAIGIGACMMRILGERGARRSFLLSSSSTLLHDKISSEVSRGLKIVGSFVPTSIAALLNKDIPADMLLTSVPDVHLEDWAVLTCHIHNLSSRFVTSLTPQNLMRLLKHFFLLAERAAAAEDCEVIYTTGGTVMICPRLDKRGVSDPKHRLKSVLRAGETILQGARSLTSTVNRLVQEPDDDQSAWTVQLCAAVAEGPCVGGMVGITKSFFKLMGPAPSLSLHLLDKAEPGQLVTDKPPSP